MTHVILLNVTRVILLNVTRVILLNVTHVLLLNVTHVILLNVTRYFIKCKTCYFIQKRFSKPHAVPYDLFSNESKSDHAPTMSYNAVHEICNKFYCLYAVCCSVFMHELDDTHQVICDIV